MMFERLTKLVREEKVSLFIGAGFSIEAQAPSVDILREAVLSQFDNDQQREEHKDDSLADITNYYVEEICSGSRNSLIEILKNQFCFTPVKMDDHQALAKIPHFHKIFTTNYDTLLEDSYDISKRQVIRKDADCAYIDKNIPVSIYKIHGDFENQDFVVVTSNDYQQFFKNNQNHLMWNEVKSSFLNDNILFIGYGLNDDNIKEIIKIISETINKNQKEMFLIAPGFDARRKGQLKKMKVHYYDAVASDFLKELTTELKNHICSDFKHHKVCAETFSRFCNIHEIDPVVSVRTDKDNQIIQYKSLDGSALKHQIDLKMPPQYKEIFENIDFEKNGIIRSNTPFPNIPLIQIKKDDLLGFTHTVNGIRIDDNVESVFLAPASTSKTITIRIPSRSFLEKKDATIYNIRKGKCVIQFDCHIYTVKVELEMKDLEDETGGYNVKFTIDFKDDYTNNNEAIKWIELLCAFFDNEEIYVNEWSKEPLKKYIEEIVDKRQYSELYNKFKKYYENVKQIEILTGVPFSKYNCFTEEAYTFSTIIVSYLKHEPTQLFSKDGFDFSSENDPDDDFVKNVKDADKFTAFYTISYEKGFVLNDQTFNIPYALLILEPSVVSNITKCDNGKIKIDFHCDSKTVNAIYSDDPMHERLPMMKNKN